MEGAVFALLGLLIAFTFSGAATRFDTRRQLIIEETSDIGTAYLRLDLLPVEAQPGLREKFREYVDARLEVYRKLPDIAAAKKESKYDNQANPSALGRTRQPGTQGMQTQNHLSRRHRPHHSGILTGVAPLPRRRTAFRARDAARTTLYDGS